MAVLGSTDRRVVPSPNISKEGSRVTERELREDDEQDRRNYENRYKNPQKPPPAAMTRRDCRHRCHRCLNVYLAGCVRLLKGSVNECHAAELSEDSARRVNCKNRRFADRPSNRMSHVGNRSIGVSCARDALQQLANCDGRLWWSDLEFYQRWVNLRFHI